MKHQPEGEGTIYLAFYHREFNNMESIKQRLLEWCQSSNSEGSDEHSHPDAFMLHCTMVHESILNQVTVLNFPQSQLLRLFEELRKHIQQLSQRNQLRFFSLELDTIAQKLDSQSYALDRTLQNIEVLSSACHRLEAARIGQAQRSNAIISKY